MTAKKQRMEGNLYLLQIGMLFVLVAIASVIGHFFRYLGFPETNIVIVYLLAVLIEACFSTGYWMGIAASVVATLAFNYFFTSPFLSLSVDDPNYMITLAVMTITSLIASTLTSRVKQSALEAQQKELETKALYTLTNHLTDAKNLEAIAGIAVSTISECFSCRAACLCIDEASEPEKTFIQQISPHKQVRRESENGATCKRRMEDLRTAYDKGPEFWDWPIYGGETVLGMIRIPSENAALMNERQIHLLQSMVESTALAMDRFQSALRHMKAREETMQERYRANLLRAVSHDIRTPLSGIIGTSEMLMDMTEATDKRHALVCGIHKEANWLRSLVENILSLTRLQDGKLTISKEGEAVEEVVSGAVGHIATRYPHREIDVCVPNALFWVPMDAKLMEQVLINLLDNAIQQTPLDGEITIQVVHDEAAHQAIFTVSDRGKGIAAENLPMIFQSFYTSSGKSSDSARGIGLGLTICEAIVKAHGGAIEARNRTDGEGAEFIVTLPLEVKTDA